MKKLGLCLLALAMVLGFVSCNKDAGTTGDSVKWTEVELYGACDSSKPLSTDGYFPLKELYYSITDIPEGLIHRLIGKCYVTKSSSINAITKVEQQIYDTDAKKYGEKQVNDFTYDFEELDFNGETPIYKLNGLGYIYGDYVLIIPENPGESLEESDNPYFKFTFYFNDGSKLVSFLEDDQGQIQPPPKPPVKPKVD